MAKNTIGHSLLEAILQRLPSRETTKGFLNKRVSMLLPLVLIAIIIYMMFFYKGYVNDNIDTKYQRFKDSIKYYIQDNSEDIIKNIIYRKELTNILDSLDSDKFKTIITNESLIKNINNGTIDDDSIQRIITEFLRNK